MTGGWLIHWITGLFVDNMFEYNVRMFSRMHASELFSLFILRQTEYHIVA